MRKFAAFLVIALIAGNAFAAPNFPALNGRVVDNANLLTPAAESELSQRLTAHEQATTNQVVVVTLPDLQGYEIADYGYQLGRHWGIGQKDKNNGVLIIIAQNERLSRIEVGYGLEGTLTDALSQQIFNSVMVPEFKKGDFQKGIIQGTTAVISVLEGKNTLVATGKKAERLPEEDYSVAAVVIFILILLIRFIIFRRTGIWIGGFGGGRSGGGGFFRGGGGRFGGGGSSGKW